MKRKVKYRNFDRTLTVALLGGLKSKRTQTKTYPSKNVPEWSQNLLKRGKNLPKLSQNVPSVLSRCTHDICRTSIRLQINRNYVPVLCIIILKIFNSALFFICLT